MLLSDIGLVADAMTALNVRRDLVEDIVTILKSNSDELGKQRVTQVAPDWFGGAPTATRLGVNTSMAHQAVEEEFQKLADSLRQYGAAIALWAEEVRDVDGSSGAEMAARAEAVEQVNATLEDARREATDRAIGDGRYTEPPAEPSPQPVPESADGSAAGDDTPRTPRGAR